MFRKLVASARYDRDQFKKQKESLICDHMIHVKNKLNRHKSKLDTIKIETIKNVMKSLDKYYSLHKILKRKYNAQIVTNAWLKCYELINEFNLLGTVDDHITIFLNAELPGSFICAINHYLKTNTSIEYDWYANSLMDPDDNTNKIGLSDRYGIFKMNKEHWVMGQKNIVNKNHNGDVTDINVIDLIEDYVLTKYPNGIFLYTSDIGVDVSHDYRNQEELNSLANLGQILLGLKLLGVNGNMIIKQYTYFTDFTLSIIVILTMVFDYVYISKPLTSKPTNSELYIICKGYRGTPLVIFDTLTKRLIHHKTHGTLPYIDGSLLNLQHYSLTKTIDTLYHIELRLFDEIQCNALDNAINAIYDETSSKKWSRNKKQFNNKHIYEHNRWLFFNNIKSIKNDQHILTNHSLF